MSRLTGLKDVDREVLKHVSDKDLLVACSVDRRMWNEVCDDNFLRRRLTAKYPIIEKYKKENETWKEFFLRFLYYKSKIWEDYKFEYVSGNFKMQYTLLNNYFTRKNRLLVNSAKEGELELVKYAVDRGSNIHTSNEEALRWASLNGHIEIVKYLVEQGADIHAENNAALKFAKRHRHNQVVKYLRSKFILHT